MSYGDYSSDRYLQTQAHTFPGNVSCSGSISFTSVVAQKNVKSSSKITAATSTLGDVAAGGAIALTETTARTVSSSSSIYWSNHQRLTSAQSIQAEGRIELFQISCDGSIIGKASLMAQHLSAQTIQSGHDMTLIHVGAPKVISQRALTARNCRIWEVTSSGKIAMENTFANTVIGKSSLIWYNIPERNLIPAHSIQADGRIELWKVSCEDSIIGKAYVDAQHVSAHTIQSGSGMELRYSEITNVNSQGELSAKECTLKAVKAMQNITLQSSMASSVHLKAVADKPVIITLKDSVINGDVVIDIQPPSEEKEEKATEIQGNVITRDTFILHVSNPMELVEFQPRVINGTKGTVNGEPYVFEDGCFSPIIAEKKKPGEMNVEIIGGKIMGSIRFLNGTGTYTLKEGAILLKA